MFLAEQLDGRRDTTHYIWSSEEEQVCGENDHLCWGVPALCAM